MTPPPGAGPDGTITSGTADVVLPRALRDVTGYLIRVAHFRALDVAGRELPKGDSPRDFGVLRALAGEGPLSQQQLAAAMHVNPTIMVELIDGLERRGLVERRRNPADRRSYALRLTAAGSADLQRVTPLIKHAEGEFLHNLALAERARLNDLLRALLAPLGPLPQALADTTGFLLAQAHHHAGALFDGALRELELAPRHGGTIVVLADIAPCSQRELARQLDINPTMMVEIVDGLEQRGLVERRRNPADRRSYALQPTARGRALARDVAARGETVVRELAAPLGERGDRDLRTLLRKLLGA